MGLQLLSDVFGWMYFVCWGFSSYPLAYNNFKRKSVEGFSFDYQIWNWSGFFWYLNFTIIGTIFQEHYEMQKTIHPNDIAFAINAFFACSIIGIQCFIYPSGKREHIFHPVHLTLVIVIWVLAIYNVLLGLGEFLPWYSKTISPYAFSVIQFLGFAKSFVSFIKYTPQAYLNYKGQNTLGWAITNTWMDAGGGILSLAQMIVDAYANPLPDGSANWEKITGNVPKLLLAVESLAFDFLFITQHYFLYADNNRVLREKAKQGELESTLLLDAPESESSLEQKDYSVNI